MIELRAMRKIVIPMVGLTSGILLFLVTFSMLLNNVIFNSKFQNDALDRLGIYESVVELAETLSTEINISQNQLEPIVRNTVTPDLVSLNVKSLIDGLTTYFKGYTKKLPDLYLAGMNDNNGNAAFTTASGQPLAGLEKINLRVLFMVLGERHINDIMLVVSLLQFILTNIPIFGLLLFMTVLTLMLHNPPLELRALLQSTAASYFILCLIAGSLIQLILYTKLPHLVSLIDKLKPISKGVLSEYITYSANTLSVQFILSGMILFGAVQAAVLLSERIHQSTSSDACILSCSYIPSLTSMDITDKAHNAIFIRETSIVMLTLITLSSVSLYIQFREASQNFADRNLGQAVSFLKGNNHYYQVTNARKDQVYLLDMKVLDSITKLPVQDLGARVGIKDKNGIEPIQCTTDSEGSAVFLLDKGSFRLILDPVGALADYNYPDSLSYEFEMTTPGKAELTVMLERQANGLSFIKNATMQYIP